MAKKHCECCGAPMVEYKHSLSRGLLRGLYLLMRAGGGPLNLNDIELNYNQQSNFQKLKYWGLVEKSEPENAKGGVWNITEAGRGFLYGVSVLPKTAITYRGSVVGFEGDAVLVMDVTGGWWYRPDYAEQSIPAGWRSDRA